MEAVALELVLARRSDGRVLTLALVGVHDGEVRKQANGRAEQADQVTNGGFYCPSPLDV